MKVKIPVASTGTGKKRIAVVKKAGNSLRSADIGLTEANNCVCKTMDSQHCPIHAVRFSPAPGTDVIR